MNDSEPPVPLAVTTSLPPLTTNASVALAPTDVASILSVDVNPAITAWSPPVVVIVLASSVFPPPSNVSVPVSVAFGEVSATMPPPSTVLPADVLPLMLSVPPLKTSVPVRTALFTSKRDPPFSTTSLVRCEASPLTVLKTPKIWSPDAEPVETVSVAPAETIASLSTPLLTTSWPPLSMIAPVTLPPFATKSSLPLETVNWLVVEVVTVVVVIVL